MSDQESVFSALDYIIFIAMLSMSVLIGMYHAFVARHPKTSLQYFLANRSMHYIPVSISVGVSIVSAITYLGTPAEVYLRGPGYWPSALSRPIAGLLVAVFLIPVFYNLKITSIFEYLGMRFSPVVRYFAVTAQFVTNFFSMGVAIYAPALALNAVTGLSLSGSILTVGIVCTFYSAIGGIVAVIWVDIFQSVIMVVGLVSILVIGYAKLGGIDELRTAAVEGNRSRILDFRFDPTIRFTFWSTFVGGAVSITAFTGVSQNIVQRALTCRDLQSAKWAVFLGLSMFGILELLAVIVGVTIFAYYFGCDPLTLGRISRVDQIVPYFMVEVFTEIPGVTGFLISAIFCAALSTVSTAINALATVAGRDIIKVKWPLMSEETFTLLVKIISVLFGCAFMITAFLASSLGSIIQTTVSIFGAMYGPVLGIFFLGVLVPRANNTGALAGTAVGFTLGMWILVGSFSYPPPSSDLPLSISQCSDISSTENPYEATMETLPITTAPLVSRHSEEVLFQGLYSISFLYNTLLSFLSSFLVGTAVSILTNSGKDYVHPKLLSPVLLYVYRRAPTFVQDMMKVKGTSESPAVGAGTIAMTGRDVSLDDSQSRKAVNLAYGSEL